MAEKQTIAVQKDGPYIVEGSVPLYEDALAKNEDGVQDYFRVRSYEVSPTYALCRCGHSKSKPFCDGSHATAHFDGTETAGHQPYAERAQTYSGRDIDLQDDNRCAFARLCHQKTGDVWTLTEQEDGGASEAEAVQGSWHCPTGRLQHQNRETAYVYEQEYEPSIVTLEDTEEGVSGPLFVRGGIPLSDSSGQPYEQRNRYALCRCGHSRNKPFCDAAHVPAHFDDGSPALDGERQFPRDSSFAQTPEL